MNNDHCCLLSFRPLYYFLECNLFEKRKALEDFFKVFSMEAKLLSINIHLSKRKRSAENK